MQLVKNSERLQPAGDLLPYTDFFIAVTPDFELACLMIYSPSVYPPEQAVLWETYDPVTGNAAGQTMSVPEAARGLTNLGLDAVPFLKAAAALGWLALADAVIRGELYDVIIEVQTDNSLRVEVLTHLDAPVFTGSLYPEGTLPATAAPLPAMPHTSTQ